MKDFEQLVTDTELNEIIDSINNINKNTLYACHGRTHTMFVVNTICYILTSLDYDARTIELGKITGLLHDIGVINGKSGHAKNSSIMCKKFLDKTALTDQEKDIVIHAILDHSNGDDITSPVGAALLLSDKIDLSKNRVLELGRTDYWHSNLLEIETVEIKIEHHVIIINYIVTNQFKDDVFQNEWKKGTQIPIKASEYFNCTCRFQINHKPMKLQ